MGMQRYRAARGVRTVVVAGRLLSVVSWLVVEVKMAITYIGILIGLLLWSWDC